MNKEGLISAIAEETGLTKIKSHLALDAIVKIIKTELVAGESIKISDLGVFEVKERAPRTGRNPRTNELLPIPAKRVPHFRPSDSLKVAVSSSNEGL